MNKDLIFIAFFVLIISILTGFDVIEDLKDGAEISHVFIEISIAIIGSIIFIYLLKKFLQGKKTLLRLKNEKESLKSIISGHEKKSALLLEGLHKKIDDDFQSWAFTPAERDVAIFLLKGISPKEISDFRSTSEKTVRHQINSIYKKSNSKNREEFMALFLEDLF